MSTIPYASGHVEPQLPFKDKRPALIGAGVFCFVIAGLTGCGTIVTPLALVLPGSPGTPRMGARELVPAVGMYLLVTVFFAALGVGAVRARRWVRPILLPAAWTWLVAGVLGTAIWLLTGPGLTEMLQASATANGGPPPAPGLADTVAVITAVIMIAVMLMVPGLFIWLLSPESVRLTAQHFSPAAWTDGRPLPVLAIAMWLALTSLGMLVGVGYPVFSVFGFLLTGPAAVVAIVVTATLVASLAWQVARQRRRAWGATVAAAVLWMVNAIVTAVRVDPLEMLRRAGHPQAAVDMMAKVEGSTRTSAITSAAVFGLAVIAYLWHARRHFSQRADLSPPPPLGPISDAGA